MDVFSKMIAKDFKKMKKTIIDKNNIINLRKKLGKKSHINYIPSNKTTTVTKIKYKINNVKLSGRYLKKYNNLMYNNSYYNVLYRDLIDSGYYYYDIMIKQKLSRCGLNRTKQLYGTCWLDSLMNGFIFGKNIRNRFLKLLDYYIKVNEITDIKKYIKNMNAKYIKLSRKVDKTNMKIFLRFIGILYQVLCDKGIRNKVSNVHDNFIVTNFAINVRNINTLQSKDIKKKDVLKGNNIAYNSYYALEYILYIFNKYINNMPNLTYSRINNMDKSEKIYSMNNPFHINKLYFTINKMEQYITPGTEYNVNIKNIKINTGNRSFTFDKGEKISSMDNIDFLIFSCMDKKDPLYKKIPKEIECIVNDKKYLFKLDYAGISIDIKHESVGHAVTGIICNDSYYIYDPYNNYFKVDWTDLSDENMKHVASYYKIIMADKFEKSYNKETNKTILYQTGKEPKIDIYIEYAMYYNTTNSFSYKMKDCNPSR